jgi:protocatechuate 3,4-dioxygenase beta subunit
MTSRFSRREFIKLGIAVGATTVSVLDTSVTAFANPAPCRLTPEQEVGPYWLDGDLVRRDIREGKAGIPLTLDIVLTNASACGPLVGAAVDIWHCDAMGIYSGYTKVPAMMPDFDPKGPPGQGPGRPPMGHPPGPPPAMRPTDHLTFLRGIQRTDRAGTVRFETILPGNYQGRTNHIHFKVRTANALHQRESHVSHVGQIFFPEALMVQLMSLEPYSDHAIRRTTQKEDPVFANQSGSVMVANVSHPSPDDPAKGLYARVAAAVDPAAEPRPVDSFPMAPPR